MSGHHTDRVAQHEGGQEPEDSFMGDALVPTRGSQESPPPASSSALGLMATILPALPLPSPGISSFTAPLGRTLVTASQPRRIARCSPRLRTLPLASRAPCVPASAVTRSGSRD